MRRLLLASAALATLAAAPQRALQDAERAGGRAREQQRQAADQARAASADEQRLARERVAAAARLSTTETAVAARAAEVAALAEQRDEAARQLAARAQAMGPLLPLIERLALYPAETMLAVPGSPEQTLRALSVLRGLAGRLEADASGLRQEQERLAARQTALDTALPALRAAQAEQAAQARALDAEIASSRAERRQAEQEAAEAGSRAAAEAARAESLRGAVAALEAERARAEARARADAARAERRNRDSDLADARRREEVMARPSGPAPDPRGGLSAPVAGSIVRGWGDATEAGPATGVSYRAAPQARVVAPCGGRIRFAGPFRSFGRLLILDCGGGTAVVLAGLGRLDVALNATVLPGEPLGTMPDWDPAASGPRPALYVEVRHDGQAVNPLPYLRGRG